MKKSVQLLEALEKSMEGKKVEAVVDVTTMTIKELMYLEDIGASFEYEVSEENGSHVPAISIESMEGDILDEGCTPPRGKCRNNTKK